MGIIIKSTGRGIPANVIDNHYLSGIVDTSDEWITERTGISQRRIASSECSLTLSLEAAKNAIEQAGIEPNELDLIIMATVTSDNLVPSNAACLQRALNIDNAVAFDINAACTGFIYALCIAQSLMTVLGYNKALIVGVEVLSKITNWEDRNTCVLFGDGAGAVVLEKGEKNGIIKSFMANQKDDGEVLTCKNQGINNILVSNPEPPSKLYMDGNQVFRFAVDVLAKTIRTLLETSQKNVDDITWIIPHQANKRIIEHTARKLKIDKSKFYMNLQHYGNTSAASIPIALDQLNRDVGLKQDDNIIMVGFGGGLSYGGVVVQWQ